MNKTPKSKAGVKIRLMRALPYDDVMEMLRAERGDWKQSDLFNDDELLDFVQSSASNWSAERFAFCVDVPRSGVGYVTAHRSFADGFGMLRLWLHKRQS